MPRPVLAREPGHPVAPQSLAAAWRLHTRYDARKERVPVKEYLLRQRRFAHLVDEDVAYVQQMVDAMWEEWEIPGVAPLKPRLA